MDNQNNLAAQATEPSALNIDGAAQALGAFLEPGAHQKSARELEREVLNDLSGKPADGEAQAQIEQDEVDAGNDVADDDAVTIEVDGKTVKLSRAELADAYKNGLRQSDYTKKTMEVAETRKAAEAEIRRAAQERQTYAVNLQKMAAQIEGALVEQKNIDWEKLLDTNPAEYLKQQHLYQQRHAAYQKNIQQQKYQR